MSRRQRDRVMLDDHQPPRWLRDVPSGVLFLTRQSQPIDAWCAEQGYPRPSLLDLAAERHRRQQKRQQRAGQGKAPART